jgi:hypothetical protein
MNNVLENVIAAVIVTTLSTFAAFALRVFGLSAQASITIGGIVLCVFGLLFLVVRKYYPKYKRKLTEQLIDHALDLKGNETEEEKKAFKTKILERVHLEGAGVQLRESSSVVEFINQEACETHIQEASHNAKKVKILTIRGEKYFLGPNSYLHHLCTSKRAKDSIIEVLVLSPDTKHLTDDLAVNLDHESAEEIREKMRVVIQYLILLASKVRNFEVKCYDERPNFKILLFDDIMFVSSFAGGGPKNDHRAKMLQIVRDGNPLFVGFECMFDDLSRRSVAVNSVVGGRV